MIKIPIKKNICWLKMSGKIMHFTLQTQANYICFKIYNINTKYTS